MAPPETGPAFFRIIAGFAAVGDLADLLLGMGPRVVGEWAQSGDAEILDGKIIGHGLGPRKFDEEPMCLPECWNKRGGLFQRAFGQFRK